MEEERKKKKNIIFSKFLTKTDILKTLAIPINSLAPFYQHFNGGQTLKLVAKDETGKQWPFVCSVRKTGHKKPVFQRKGWRSFVLAKSLTVGDKVIFYQDGVKVFGSILADKSASPTYGIEVERGTTTNLAALQSFGGRSISSAYSCWKFLAPAARPGASDLRVSASTSTSTTSNNNRPLYW